MKKKAEKKQQAEELRAQLATVSTVILSTFQGITVEQDTQLRRSVEAAGGEYMVVKNTVAERAAAGTQAEGLLKDLKGTNSIAFTKTDPVALAKILTKVAKDVPAFQFRAGLVEGRVISIQEIGQLAQLPSKEELLSKIMFMLNAPAQRVASALAAVSRSLAVVTSEAVKANKFGGGTAAAAPAASAASSPAPAASSPATEASTPTPTPAASEAPATEAAATPAASPEPEPAQ